jgi:uncharacterized protein (TIGR02001 family)
MTRLILGVAAALLLTAGQAAADGMPTRGKTKAAEPDGRPCTVSANVGLSTDYVFRGISKTFEDPAVQGGFDLTCGRFYAGVAASNVDFGAVSPFDTVANIEVSIYGGFKANTGPVAWDLGVIYYTYPGDNFFVDLNFVELKVAASGEVWKGGTLGATVFFSPEYIFETGEVLTVEGTFAQVLPNVGMFTPTFSATIGRSEFQDFDFLSYTYWNVGLTLGFHERWSVDLRYWDTDGEGAALLISPLSDERFVGSLKYRF